MHAYPASPHVMSIGAAPAARATSSAPPLVVDLDGTLVRSDLLWEAFVLILRQRFWRLCLLPVWLLAGRAEFKRRVARLVDIDPAALPYDRALLDQLAAWRAQGRLLVLATGSERCYAERVAAHLGLFDAVHATGEGVNLTAHAKAAHLADTYGEQGFDYVGNASADLPVWACAREAYSVTARPFVLADGRSTTHIGSRRGSTALALLRALRPRQWLKNLLVFLPMLAGHALNATALAQSLAAFAAFSLCASSAYLLNDTLDAQDDRLHPTKRKRPIAAGELPLPFALAASPLLALAAVAVAASSGWLLLTVAVYFVTTLCYSFVLKRLLMVDIITLAVLYSLRIAGGGASTHIAPSSWLLAFSFFIFLSLALLKRHSELFNLARQGDGVARGRGYIAGDRVPIGIMGVASAFLSVLIFMLYFTSQNVTQLYHHPAFLYAVVPLLVFWLGRLWLLSFRGEVNEDPVLYVSKDPVSLAVLAACAAVATAASL